MATISGILVWVLQEEGSASEAFATGFAVPFVFQGMLQVGGCNTHNMMTVYRPKG